MSWGKSDKMQGMLSILSPFCYKFNKIQLYRSMNEYDLKLSFVIDFWCENV